VLSWRCVGWLHRARRSSYQYNAHTSLHPRHSPPSSLTIDTNACDWLWRCERGQEWWSCTNMSMRFRTGECSGRVDGSSFILMYCNCSILQCINCVKCSIVHCNLLGIRSSKSIIVLLLPEHNMTTLDDSMDGHLTDDHHSCRKPFGLTVFFVRSVILSIARVFCLCIACLSVIL
jgi:hypothetical protein